LLQLLTYSLGNISQQVNSSLAGEGVHTKILPL